MKKTLLFVIIVTLAVIGLASCEKLKEKLFQAFVTGTTSADFTLAIIDNTNTTADWGTVSVPFDMDKKIKESTDDKFDINDAPQVTFNEIVVTILNADQNNNWANFETGSLRFNTNSNTTPIQVGKYENNPDVYAASKTFIVENTVDLKSYLKGATTIGYLYAGKLRRETTKPLQLRIDFKFKVGK